MHKSVQALGIVALIGLSSFSLQAETGLLALDRQRLLYEEALSAWKAKTFSRFLRLTDAVSPTYPLYPHLLYLELNRNIETLDRWSLLRFTLTYEDSPLADLLRKRWLQVQAEKQNWKEYLAVYEPSDGTYYQCYGLQAAYEIEPERLPALSEQIAALWNVERSQDSACDGIFSAWLSSEENPSQSLVLERLEKTVSSQQYSIARYLTRFLSETDKPAVLSWIALSKSPEKLADLSSEKLKKPFSDIFLPIIFDQLADENILLAIEQWKRIDKKFVSSEAKEKIQQSIALHMALTGHPDTESQINQLSNVPQPIQEWRIRNALSAQDWLGVLRGIAALEETVAQGDRWVYWRARALEKSGSERMAQSLYQQISANTSFYGFLASERISVPYALLEHNHQPYDVSDIAKIPGIQRAREYRRMGQDLEARREWYRVIKSLTTEQRLAAARLASQMGWHHFTLFSLNGVESQTRIPMHFPLGYYTHVFEQADAYQLDPAWIFAITHQESLFKTDAKSSRGAIGLMQLLPSTAKQVAQTFDLPYQSQWDLIKADKNIRLGAGYLRLLMEDFSDNIVLSTAAFNAGPERVKQWIPDSNESADIWIETVPFYETRHYLQKVLTNLTIYRQLLGDTTSLQTLLAPIGPHQLAFVNPDTGKRT